MRDIFIRILLRGIAMFRKWRFLYDCGDYVDCHDCNVYVFLVIYFSLEEDIIILTKVIIDQSFIYIALYI